MGQTQIQDIIYRYFRGQLAENEYEQLVEWLQDTSNREYFERKKQEWSSNPVLDETGVKNWKHISSKINMQGSAPVGLLLTRRLWLRVASVAAILILGLLGGGALTYFYSEHQANQGQLVFETPRGEKSMVTLPDGSKVWLNANSRLVYNTFSSSRRQVELKGEAFFKIARNERAPFTVKTNECDIEVLGTTFNVMAYDEFGRKEITLLSGRINVQMGGNEQILKPGQALILKDHQFEVSEVNATQSSAWVDNKFNFKDIPLSELMKRLENWYDVDITLENLSGREVNYTGTFKNEETIWQVLDAIEVYTPMRYEKSETRKIKITIE